MLKCFAETERREDTISQNAAMDETSSGELFDVIIIGAGIMGSCAAYEAAKLGKKVLLLEQFDLLHHLGSSHGESRTIRATYSAPHYPPMVIESSRLWEEAQAESGYRVLTKTTQFDIGPADTPSLQSIITNCSTNSLALKVFDTDSQLAEQFSGAFRLPVGWLSLSTSLGGVIKPTKAVSMFQSLAIRHRATIRDRAEVAEIKRDGIDIIRVSTTDGRQFRGNKCVLTVGAWSRKLIKAIRGLELPIQPLHALVWYWKIKDGFEPSLSAAGGFPTFAYFGEPQLYGTPSMEFPGLIKISLVSGWPCDPDRRDWTIGGGDESAVMRKAADCIELVMPGRIETARGPVMTQACMYSMTPDEDYVIDFLGGEFGKDVVVAGGFSGHGFKMGPVVGRILSEMAVDGEAETAVRIGVDMKVFGMGRFEGNPKGNV
ncbi:probable sarcosine oxidase [Dendrobium catenatum]|uniref:probable sarcosine oxidase n=1 Tax=Dendrobium catenatum TaxID=906689 RepID=UPI0009F61054|nr:probable sarcosine oxidase [Dendrobium catenatum]